MPFNFSTELRPKSLDLIGTPVLINSGTVVYKPNQPVDYIYEAVSGLIKIYTKNQTNEDSLHVIYSKGEIFPVSWLVDKKPYGAYICAIEDLKLIRYKRDDFLKLIKNDPDVSFYITTCLIHQLRIYTSRLDNLEYKYASERLAYRLIFLAKRFGKVNGKSITLPAFNNLDIAKSINLSREHVNRELSKFTKKKLIKTQNKRIVILNMDLLRAEIGNRAQPLFLDDF